MDKFTDAYGAEYEVLYAHSLTCTEGTAKKFWIAKMGKRLGGTPVANPYRVTLHWGRIGTAGTKSHKDFQFSSHADDYFRGRRLDKLRKGYKSVEEAAVTTSVPVAASVQPTMLTDWDLL